MEEQDVRARAEALCTALVAGDIGRATEDFSKELRQHLGEVLALLPLPSSEASIESIERGGGSGYTVVLRLVGETEEALIQTRWKERLDQGLLGLANKAEHDGVAGATAAFDRLDGRLARWERQEGEHLAKMLSELLAESSWSLARYPRRPGPYRVPRRVPERPVLPSTGLFAVGGAANRRQATLRHQELNRASSACVRGCRLAMLARSTEVGVAHDAVLSEIRRLDPVTDHQRIAFLTSLHEFPWDTTRSLELALFRAFAVAKGTALLAGTGEFTQRTQKRYDDTVLILAEILEHGYDSERGKAALRRMNQMHGRHPIPNDEFLYVLSTFVFEPIRWNERFGWRPLLRQEKLASFHFWREIARRMAIRDVPDDYEASSATTTSSRASTTAIAPENRALATATRDLCWAGTCRSRSGRWAGRSSTR